MVRATRVQSQVESCQRLKKMVLDPSLFNSKHYKVRIKGKVVQSSEYVHKYIHTSMYSHFQINMASLAGAAKYTDCILKEE